MKHGLCMALALLLVTLAQAQTRTSQPRPEGQTTPQAEPDTIALQRMAAHVALFGNQLPQEKVYVHMDNTCYFLDDTIWFAAYTRQTNLDVPSRISRVLYAELYNQDGYLVERQLIRMENGRGHGQFALQGDLYSGYYELRAYTRWQLNWGETEHEHTDYAEEWFFNKQMAKDYYRDYDKIYSRVFPVYDRVPEPGFYQREMTLRPLRRYFKTELDPPALVLSLFPEGGQLVEGAACRVAFEAADEEGEWKEGRVELTDQDGRLVTAAPTEHRGRGILTFTPEAGRRYRATFYSTAYDTIQDPSRGEKRHLTVRTELPEAETNGVGLMAEAEADGSWLFTVSPRGNCARQALGLTVMHQGMLDGYRKVQDGRTDLAAGQGRGSSPKGDEAPSVAICFPANKLKAGVNQVTVYDVQGRVLADRLFFVTQPELFTPTLKVGSLHDRYRAFEPIELDLASRVDLSASDSLDGGATVSVAVRDAVMQDYTYDSGNIMTEMLLSSELKGYVPQPEWYFASDDSLHRRALQLLMLTQGWRRFQWQTMALPYAFEQKHPAEYTQVLTGEVYRYTAFQKEDPLDLEQFVYSLRQADMSEQDIRREVARTYGIAIEVLGDKSGVGETDAAGEEEENANWTNNDPDLNNVPMYSKLAGTRFIEMGTNLKRDVLVHAEFFRPGDEGLEGEAETDGGHFSIPTPDFEGAVYFMLAASDTTKWKKPKVEGKASSPKSIYRRIRQTHQWVSADEEAYPEFYVRIKYPYPRFVKPYNYYQKQLAQAVSDRYTSEFPGVEEDKLHRNLMAVTVRAKRGGLRSFDPSKPAFKVDAYEAFNETVDAGFFPAYFAGASTFVPNVARAYIGDMNQYRSYGLVTRYEGLVVTQGGGADTGGQSFRFATPASRRPYNSLRNLDSVYVYTDYAPREEGSERYAQSNQPTVTVDLRRYANEAYGPTFRDRRILLHGFSAPAEFYHPDYRRNLPKDGQKDYRRTLYWNPELRLDPSGLTRITLYNNSKLTTVNVSAAGMTPTGQLLYNAE